MSLYNLVHGENSAAGLLLAILGTDRTKVPRYRDCWYADGQIAIHTRTGGGNRDDYEAENDALTLLPGYAYDEDDDFDCTYATFYYSVPPVVQEAIKGLETPDGSPGERWQGFFEKLKSGGDDEQVKRVLDATRPLLEKIAEFAKT